MLLLLIMTIEKNDLNMIGINQYTLYVQNTPETQTSAWSKEK